MVLFDATIYISNTRETSWIWRPSWIILGGSLKLIRMTRSYIRPTLFLWATQSHIV